MSLSPYRHFSAVIGQAKRGKAHLTDHEVCIGSCTRGRLEELAIAGGDREREVMGISF